MWYFFGTTAKAITTLRSVLGGGNSKIATTPTAAITQIFCVTMMVSLLLFVTLLCSLARVEWRHNSPKKAKKIHPPPIHHRSFFFLLCMRELFGHDFNDRTISPKDDRCFFRRTEKKNPDPPTRRTAYSRQLLVACSYTTQITPIKHKINSLLDSGISSSAN